jgi:ribonuclease VapC
LRAEEQALEAYVLDSFALLAYLQGEEGGQKVRALLERAVSGQVRVAMSYVNLGEVLYIVEREEGMEAAQKVLATVDSLPLSLHGVSRLLALRAAHLKARHQMAYADCFAAALALELGATVVTGDPEFREVEGEVPVLWIHQAGAA